MTAASLLELAERVEHRERERVPLALEKEIASAFGHGTYRPYTTSLDAALTLVPEGCSYELAYCIDLKLAAARVYRGPIRENSAGEPHGSHRNPSAALVAACLRARAQKEQKDG